MVNGWWQRFISNGTPIDLQRRPALWLCRLHDKVSQQWLNAWVWFLNEASLQLAVNKFRNMINENLALHLPFHSSFAHPFTYHLVHHFAPFCLPLCLSLCSLLLLAHKITPSLILRSSLRWSLCLPLLTYRLGHSTLTHCLGHHLTCCPHSLPRLSPCSSPSLIA